MENSKRKKAITIHASKARNVPAFEIERLSQLIFTPLPDAVSEIKKRRNDPALVEKVKAYLGGDIPEHFSGPSPVFYLQRFIATPNYELLHVAELVKPFDLPLVVGQDFKSKFSTNNELKLHLGKLPVMKGLSQNKDEIIEYFTVIDFNRNNGKPLQEITTKFGNSVVDFHQNLLNEIHLSNVQYVDESSWIDRNHRDNIYAQYKKVWALLCVHGIMLESYVPADYSFFTHVVYPSFKEVEAELGVTPLVCEHIPPELEPKRNWNSYPSYVYQYIKRLFK
jgi:hypothetical protein